MITRKAYEALRARTLTYFEKASIILTAEEKDRVEVADFGLDDIEHFGLELVTYVNTDRVCAKEMVLFPMQICPEHRHPSLKGQPGKEETFRCRAGRVYLYVSGEPTAHPHAVPPASGAPYLTVWHEIMLGPGEQHTIHPDTPHWFQSGPEGAVVSEFSTTSHDETDIFTDPHIRRAPVVE